MHLLHTITGIPIWECQGSALSSRAKNREIRTSNKKTQHTNFDTNTKFFISRCHAFFSKIWKDHRKMAEKLKTHTYFLNSNDKTSLTNSVSKSTKICSLALVNQIAFGGFYTVYGRNFKWRSRPDSSWLLYLGDLYCSDTARCYSDHFTWRRRSL